MHLMKKGKTMERNLTTGSVFKNMVLFSLPYLLSYFLQTLYGMADLFIIGQFGSVADITSVSIGSQVMHMLTVMIVGLAMGTTVAVGRFVGAKNSKETSQAIGNTVTLFMIVSAVLTVVLLLLVKPIASVMSTPDEAFDGTVAYLTICFIGIPFITSYNIISSIFRGIGDSKSPMYFIAVSCAANILLDYLFMGVLGMGPSGAALGTVLSQTVSVIISLMVVVKRNTGISLSKKDFIPKSKTIGQILKVGIPIAVQDGLIQVAFIFITVIANKRGLNDAAAVGIVEKIIGIFFLIPSSMMSSVSALSAQNFGANKPDRARLTLKYGIIITVCFGFVVSVAAQFFSEQLVGLFGDDAAVMVLGGQYLRSYVWDCMIAGVHFCFSGYFCAMEKSSISFIHNIIAIVTARIPIAYFASKSFPNTLYPMGWAAPVGSLISVIICIAAFVIIEIKAKDVSK